MKQKHGFLVVALSVVLIVTFAFVSDGCASFTPIDFGETISDSIDFPGDNDTYTFNATPGDTVYIRMRSSWYHGPEIRLIAPNGTMISYASGYTTYFSELTQRLNDSGEYRILAGDYQGDATGSYIITLCKCTICKCGDVNCNDKVDMGDVGALHNHVQYDYILCTLLCDTRVGDVNCDTKINMGDVGLLHNHVQYGQALNCCPS